MKKILLSIYVLILGQVIALFGMVLFYWYGGVFDFGFGPYIPSVKFIFLILFIVPISMSFIYNDHKTSIYSLIGSILFFILFFIASHLFILAIPSQTFINSNISLFFINYLASAVLSIMLIGIVFIILNKITKKKNPQPLKKFKFENRSSEEI